MNEVKLHIDGLDGFFAGATAAARRVDGDDLREQPGVIAFETMDVLLKVLTSGRWQLLRTLRAAGPMSIRRLSQDLRRDYRAVHADVQALISAGLIDRTTAGGIRVPWDRITAEMAIDLAA